MMIDPPPEVEISASLMYAPWVDWRVEQADIQYEQLHDKLGWGRIRHHPCDDEKSSWENRRDSLYQALETDATHHMVVQGDVELCEGFAEAAYNAVRAVPTRIVQFFGIWDEQVELFEHGHRWMRREGFPWGQALVMPMDMVEELLRWDEQFPTEFWSDDDYIGCWNVLESAYDIWVTAPSLVEHLGATRTTQNKSTGRVDRTASVYVDEHTDMDATDIDWSFNFGETYVQKRYVKKQCLERMEERGMFE